MASAKTPAAAAADPAITAADLLATREKPARFKITGPEVEVKRGVYVARGVSINGDEPSLVVIAGDAQRGVPFAAVARAIFSGAVITDAEVETLRAARA